MSLGRPYSPYCCYCGERIPLHVHSLHPQAYTREHLVPRSKGGNNTHLNKQPCCKRCNQDKGNLTLEQWIVRLEKRLRRARGGERYRLEAMVENARYWLDYVCSKGKALTR